MSSLRNYLTDKNVIDISEKVKLVNDSILKNVNDQRKVYSYLERQNVIKVIYPNEKLVLDNQNYYLFPYYQKIDYPASQKLNDLKEALIELHDKTKVVKVLKKNNYKYLYRIIGKLDIKFKMLELFMREAEGEMPKNDHDWIVLSKYYTYIDCKKELYRLQRIIHQGIEEGKSVVYGINHGVPEIDHLVDKRLISLDNSKIGFIVSDIAKVYVLNEHISIDWFNYIDSWLGMYEDIYYKVYFKFLVLYIYILNINLNNEKYKTLNNYIQINNKIKKAMIIFSTY